MDGKLWPTNEYIEYRIETGLCFQLDVWKLRRVDVVEADEFAVGAGQTAIL